MPMERQASFPGSHDPRVHLRVSEDDQGDVYVCLIDGGRLPLKAQLYDRARTEVSAEVRITGPGGGNQRLRTIRALRALLDAIEQDNREIGGHV